MRNRSLAIAILVLFGAVDALFAQSSVGSLSGQASANAVVILKNIDTEQTRQVSANTEGRFNFTALAPGSYSVKSGNSEQDVRISIGKGSRVNLAELALDAVIVSGRVNGNPIDMSSVESSSVFTAEQLQKLPLPRDITNVALLAPGTVKGDTAFGNLASFGGASVAENGYYVNGFDVTNLRKLISYAAIPYDGIAEQQIKTGGYGAEFGRSLGGVINIVTQRGTNTWQGGVSAYWDPEFLRERTNNVLSRNIAEDRFSNYGADNRSNEFVYTASVGGPAVPERLFIYALVEGRKNSSDGYEARKSNHSEANDPTGILKLDYVVNDTHTLEFTGIRNRVNATTRFFLNAPDSLYSGRHEIPKNATNTKSGGEVFIGKYTGHLSDTFTLSATLGQLNNTVAYRTPDPLPGGDCPAVYDSRLGTTRLDYLGCWSQEQFTLRDSNFGPDEDQRRSFRIDGEWHVDAHALRFGVDAERFESTQGGNTYSGDIYYRLFRTGSAARTVNGVLVAPDTSYVRTRTLATSSGTFRVENSALYVEDSWQVSDDFLAYLGLRSEAFENLNGDGDKFVDAQNAIAPRLGAAWDMRGDGSLKLFGNAGRYYIPVAANTNIRASGWEFRGEVFNVFDDVLDANTGVPRSIGAQVGTINETGSRRAPLPQTVAALDLEPMFQDEIILGVQQNLVNGLSVGARAIHRRIGNGFDDFCAHQGFVDWAADNGFANFNAGSLANCVIINPGRDLNIALDVNNDRVLRDVTIPARYLGLPEYKRKYVALEFFFERASTDFALQGSYTYAKSFGNVEGYVNSTLAQDDAGITQDFDFSIFTDGADGPLPNDRRHTFKTFGNYQLASEWNFGGNAILQSGRPINCNGFAPLGDDTDSATLQFYAASSFYCVNSAGVSELGQRGDRGRTPWMFSLDASVAYTPSWLDDKLQVKVDFFNLLNSQRVTEFNETGDITRSAPTQNPNYSNAVNFQSARSGLLSIRYQF